ncbi:MAG: hypothetical protein FWF71_04810 [Actinomycetia bacterium]|nr:hypothetical protein [Actinomycetes bacterium]
MPNIALEAVSKQYSGRAVLRNVSFTFAAGGLSSGDSQSMTFKNYNGIPGETPFSLYEAQTQRVYRYLRVQQKDMGILKHYGYTARSVARIYSRNLNRMFAAMAVLVALLVAVLGGIFLGPQNWAYWVMIAAAVLLPLAIVNRAVYLFMVRRYARMDILDLVKTNKEFE